MRRPGSGTYPTSPRRSSVIIARNDSSTCPTADRASPIAIDWLNGDKTTPSDRFQLLDYYYHTHTQVRKMQYSPYSTTRHRHRHRHPREDPRKDLGVSGESARMSVSVSWNVALYRGATMSYWIYSVLRNYDIN